jgi:hypothetical protein
MAPQVGTGRRRAFEPKEEGQEQNLLYLQERTPQPPGKPGKTKRWFTGDLEEGQYFFVDGVYIPPGEFHSDSYNIRDRIILFDMDPALPRYRDFEAHAKTICANLRRTHGNVWNSQLSFYANINQNPAPAAVQRMNTQTQQLGPITPTNISQEWSYQWTQIIKNEIMGEAAQGLDFEANQNFFYCPNGDVWNMILRGTGCEQEYREFSERRVQALKRSGHLPAALQKQLAVMSRATLQTQLPLPRTRLSARTDDPAVTRLQSRVAALETQLGRAQQDENTQFLLKQVLERLEDENVV